MPATTLQDLRTFIPINKVVKQAALDLYEDYNKFEARGLAWAIRGFKKITKESLKSPMRRAILPVNQYLNNAVLPCDFKEEIGVYLINSCNEKIPLTLNPKIINNALITEYPCEPECPAKCGCYPKGLCDDLQTTQVINKITLNEVEYDETVTTTLMPNGEYYIVTTTPVWNIVTAGVDYINKKEYVTSFDLATCGCIKPTAQNSCRLEAACYDAWCCYCAPCGTNNSDVGGYRIFAENGTISFDGSLRHDKVYLEYSGFLPKSGNEYLVPEVAFETLIEWTKWKSVANKKGISQYTIDKWFDSYTRERDNMRIVMGRMNLSDIVHSALHVPQFNYNYNRCGGSGVFTATSTSSESAAVSVVTSPTTVVTTGSCNPSIYTTNGSLMEGGTKYHNALLIGVPFRVFANPFNRMLMASEYNVLPTGGFEILTGVYGITDEFDIYPKWCDANVVDIPQPVVLPSIYPIKITSANFEADGVTYLNANIINDSLYLMANGTPNPLLFEPTDFIHVSGGIQIIVPGFDANTQGYTIAIQKIN